LSLAISLAGLFFGFYENAFAFVLKFQRFEWFWQREKCKKFATATI
jgi:hypothetical protein